MPGGTLGKRGDVSAPPFPHPGGRVAPAQRALNAEGVKCPRAAVPPRGPVLPSVFLPEAQLWGPLPSLLQRPGGGTGCGVRPDALRRWLGDGQQFRPHPKVGDPGPQSSAGKGMPSSPRGCQGKRGGSVLHSAARPPGRLASCRLWAQGGSGGVSNGRKASLDPQESLSPSLDHLFPLPPWPGPAV